MAQPVEPGYIRSPRYVLTRPSNTDAYAIADAIANSTDGASVIPMTFKVARENGGAGKVIGARLLTNSATAFGAMRLHLFNRPPFAAAGYQADNAALALTYAAMGAGASDLVIEGEDQYPLSVANKLPLIDFTTFTAYSSSAMSIGQCDQTELDFTCAPTSKLIYGLLEARAVFTPASAQLFVPMLSIQGLT